MPKRKTSVRVFENFLGLDLTSSDLTRDPDAALSFKNLERTFNGSLRGREGFKLAAQPLYILGLHNYVYQDEDDVTQEELICIGVTDPKKSALVGPLSGRAYGAYNWYGAPFRLKQGEFTVEYSGGASDWDVEVVFNCSTNTLEVNLYEDGVETDSFDLGKGTESSPVTLKSLADSIDGVTNFSCSAPVTAVIDGNQTTTPFTVDSGHTISLGDWVYLPTQKQFAECLATGATSVSLHDDYSLDDDDVIGHGNFPAAILDLQKQQSLTGSSVTINYWYWDPIPCGSFMIEDTPGLVSDPASLFPFKDAVEGAQFGKVWESQKQNQVSFTNQRDCVYFTSDFATEVPLRRHAGLVANNKLETVEFKAGLWKYDGKDVLLSGPINLYRDANSLAAIFPSGSLSGSSGLTDGDYKYQHSLFRKDFRGNIIESFLAFQSGATVTGGPKTVTLQYDMYDSNRNYTIPYRQFDIRGIQANGTVSSANATFTVDAGHLLRTGDTVFFIDNSGEFQERKIFSWTATTITFTEEATIADNNWITNVCFRTWRTVESGSEFFLAVQTPLTLSTGFVTNIVDDVADADLGININSVKNDSLQYNFPKMKTLTRHQGLITGAGGTLKNQIGWEDPSYPESLDYARNLAEPPTENTGQLNRIISTSDSSLLAFAENDVYEAVGSFGEATVETSSILRNTYGASGVKAALQVKQNIINLSKLGMSYYPVGARDTIPDKTILKVFRELDNLGVPGLVVEKSIVFWDSVKNWAHVVLPFEDIEVDGGPDSLDVYTPTSNSRHFVIQFPQLPDQPTLVAEFTYSEGIEALPTAGFAVHDDSLFFASRFYDDDASDLNGYLYLRSDRLRNGNEADLFVDNGASYSWEMIPQWDDGGEPERNETWHEMILYQTQPDLFVGAFDISVESYRDWSTASGKTDTSRTLSFATSGVDEQEFEFDRGYKAKRRTVKLSGTVCKNPPVLTGYSYLVGDGRYEKSKFSR